MVKAPKNSRLGAKTQTTLLTSKVVVHLYFSPLIFLISGAILSHLQPMLKVIKAIVVGEGSDGWDMFPLFEGGYPKLVPYRHVYKKVLWERTFRSVCKEFIYKRKSLCVDIERPLRVLGG